MTRFTNAQYKLMSVGIILVLGILVFGALCIIDTFQKQARVNSEVDYDINTKPTGVEVYDVGDLSNEEIFDALYKQRQLNK